MKHQPLHLINYLPSRRKYQAFLRIEGRRIYVGTFPSRVDAFIAQNDFLFSIYGPLALLRYFASRPRRSTSSLQKKISLLRSTEEEIVESGEEVPKVDISSLLSSLEGEE